MGLAGSDTTNPQDVLKVWGMDPVHPMATAYTKMAEKVLEEINVTGVVNCEQPPEGQPVSGKGHSETRRQRESWTEGTPTVANRMGKWSHGGSCGGNGGGGGSGSARGAHRGKRGSRGGHHGKGRLSHSGNRRL